MKRFFLLLLLTWLVSLSNLSLFTLYAQRQTQALDRGVVAVKNGNQVLVSWRKLAQEPEDAKYNVYVGSKKVNQTPLKVSNFSTNTTTVPVGSKVAVSIITTDKAGNQTESEPSRAFDFRSQAYNNVFVHIKYDGFLPNADYSTKFVWPADLDGDGENEWVVDRLKDNEDKIEAYKQDGTRLWTVDLGPNVHIDRGHCDMVIAYDMDCDGKAEVVAKTSDGTRFWDKQAGTYGKYLLGKATADSDGDGIINYESQSTKNPPQYITVIDGETGAEKATVEMDYPSYSGDTYTRNNKSSYRGDDNYSQLQGHMGICFLDGIHPSVGMEYMCRTTDGTHHYYVSAWGFYDLETAKKGAWKEHFTWSRNDKRPWPAEFHHIKIADVNFDGRDEILGGGYGVNWKAQMEFSAGISHGDRIRISDINPELPGLETFCIQQNASDMLGMILYESGTGKAIKKWYLAGVGDVGRGDCYDMDASHKGWEMFSTMNGNAIYDAYGDATGGTAYFPTEALWWDGDLGREYAAAPDGNGANAYVAKYGTGRLQEFAKESGYAAKSSYGCRALYWGDCTGDWREEIVLGYYDGTGCAGIVGYSTNYASSVDNIYCLMEDPDYSGQSTTRGYYQTAGPGFYLGYGMPRPPLPPVMKTDLICTATDTYTAYDRTTAASYADGKSVLFDLTTGSNININKVWKAGTIYAMPVAGQTIAVDGQGGAFAGDGDIWKSQMGTLSVNIPITTTGTTYISEGTLDLNSSIDGPVELRAKGTLSGNATLKGDVTFEGALNYEGCRLIPDKTLTFKKDLTIKNRVFMEMNIGEDKSLIQVDGNLSVTGPVVFTVISDKKDIESGRYTMIKYSGEFSGKMSNFSVRGLTGYSYDIVNEDKSIVLVINSQRQPTSGVIWTGAVNGTWDYQTQNFAIDGEPTNFVAGDTVVFDDNAVMTAVTMSELMPVGGVEFRNDGLSYTISGNGGISGNGNVTFSGIGKVSLSTVKSDYTGKTVINAGTVTVKDLADGGIASSIGAGTRLEIGRGTLVINNASTAMNRSVVLTDTATINIPSGTSAFKGLISGKGRLVKKGSGQMNFTYDGANTYSGGTELVAGTIAMGTWKATFGVASSQILVSGSNTAITIFNNNSTSAVPSFTNKIMISEGKTVTLNGGQRCSVKPVLSGSGTLKVNFPYVRGDFGPTGTTFEGTIECTSGEVRLATALNLPKATLKLDADNNVYNNNGTHKLGALSSNSTTAKLSAGTWNVGYLGTDFTYAGAYDVTVNKYGEGKMILSGAGTGAVNVNEGTLLAENQSAAITSGLITVKDGALMAGSGQVQNVTVMNGGTIGGGKGTVTAGTLTVNGNITVKSGGKVRLRARSMSNSGTDHLKVAGKISLTDPVFAMERLSGEWEEGDYKFFNGTGSISLTGDITFNPSEPKPGYLWDTSKLLTDGIISVVSNPTGIDQVASEPTAKQPTINIAGQSVGDNYKGIVIKNGKKVLIK